MKILSHIFVTFLALLSSIHAVAEEDSDTAAVTAANSADTRYGPFRLFDHRSAYGQDVFPEPFLVDDSDLESDEFRMDWLHTKANDRHTDLFTGEIEHAIGLVSLELEVPVERDFGGETKVSGFDNIDMGARAPLYQYVSAGGFVNTTFGTGLDAAIPTNSQLSKNAGFEPKLFNDLALEGRFTVQSVIGYSMLYGAGDQGGLNTFEYGVVLGYPIHQKELPIPRVEEVIPIFELQGEKELNKGYGSSNALEGDAAIRFNFDALGDIQPGLGVGFVFPMDNAAREELHWGIYTSLVFEY